MSLSNPSGRNRSTTPPTCDRGGSTQAQTTWRVDNWQVPVPVGDCSVHLLIKNPGLTSMEVVSAFIMDGGKDAAGDAAHEQILKALAAIDESLSGIRWFLDAWVVTHWDSDHYKGVGDLLGLYGESRGIRRRTVRGTLLEDYFVKNPVLYCGASPSLTGNPRTRLDEIFLVRIEGEHLIGVDLLSRTRLFSNCTKDLSKVLDKNIYSVVAGTTKAIRDRDITYGIQSVNKNTNRTQPRFCVVGANGFGMGSTAAITAKPTPNETSILAVVYWPSSGHTSYFTGGDGNPRVEQMILNNFFEKTTKANGPKGFEEGLLLPTLPIDFMKLDHHGSSNENLRETELGKNPLARFRPKNVLVTPGDQYGHPTWDVLQYVRDHLNDQSNRGRPGHLHTTRSPYWMTKDKPHGMDINVGHLTNLTEMLDEDLKKLRIVDDSELTDDQLLAEERDNMLQDAKEEKTLKASRLAKIQVSTTKSKKAKVTAGAINSRNIKKEEMAMLKQLGRALLDDNIEEPETSNLQDFIQSMREHRHQLQSSARESWNAICEQPILHAGNPYFLLYFTFSKTTSSIEVFDEDGTEKRIIVEPPPPVSDTHTGLDGGFFESKSQMIEFMKDGVLQMQDLTNNNPMAHIFANGRLSSTYQRFTSQQQMHIKYQHYAHQAAKTPSLLESLNLTSHSLLRQMSANLWAKKLKKEAEDNSRAAGVKNDQRLQPISRYERAGTTEKKFKK
ncbi:hypothetical protein B0T14DRAFT_565578 [Immersiella caudata]|uniref:Metallo-beta-lactamase domain-containing protein n=1 Tax=Immersiella caudata TaxID=314043 RepID=A0AA39WZ58_9PEZI|nr:hypothetical protein B0T14DRAFT_565578 [Immersiella caudata]